MSNHAPNIVMPAQVVKPNSSRKPHLVMPAKAGIQKLRQSGFPLSRE